MNTGKETVCGLVIACGYGATILQARERIFNLVPLLVQRRIVLGRRFASFPGRDHGLLAQACQHVSDTLIGIITLVGYQRARGYRVHQSLEAAQVAGLTTRQMKSRRPALCVAYQVNLARQAPSASADALALFLLGLLALLDAPFLRAPAALRWARTSVESIMAYSLSLFLEREWKIFSHTPCLLHRAKRP